MTQPDAPDTGLLLGRQATALGEMAVAEVGPSLTAVLSRGAFPKGYEHIDPNEDAAFAASLGDAMLLVVADGHNGMEAAQAATTAIAEHATAILRAPANQRRQPLAAAIATACDNVAAATAELSGSRRCSATALTAACTAGDHLLLVSVGDTTAVRLRSRRVKQLTAPRPFLDRDTRPEQISIQSRRLHEGDKLILLTDGVYEFLGPGWRREVSRLARNHGSSLDIARSLVEAAFEAGAGDNVAVVVALL